ncbi:MAG TPA: ATP-binding protein [Flavisolibacter sp.]|jgi:K+-sensing histidine kinase KdpD|nr:ATP-binding protein [Flavisolibacter sp.]
MADERKKKLKRATIVYWVLLSYIIAALLWWFFSLVKQNNDMYVLQKEYYQATGSTHRNASQLAEIEAQHRRNIAKFIGEGGTFLMLIIVGAAYIYRSVRNQFRLQQQQQNFVMAITHELKTPIAVSRLNLETMQKHKLEEPMREKLVQTTLQETLRLDRLINNILISSQLEGHSYNLNREELCLSDLARDLLHQFQIRYPDRKLVSEIEDDLEIKGDALLLKLLLSNLMENANKYSPKEFPIRFSLTRFSQGIRMEVKDEGTGIPEAERKNIFQKFYRIGNEHTRRTQGTGLGLYLCRIIAEDHKGTIEVADNHPQGSNFIVEFPV